MFFFFCFSGKHDYFTYFSSVQEGVMAKCGEFIDKQNNPQRYRNIHDICPEYNSKISNIIIKLHKEIIGAEKVYLCTVCDGKRNHLHFSLFPRLKGETIGFGNFVKEDGIIMDYHETVEIYKQKMKESI